MQSWVGSVQRRRLDFTAIGDSVNTAKRIQENAAKNVILISKVAYDRVKDQVEAKVAAPLAAKGKSSTDRSLRSRGSEVGLIPTTAAV